MARFTFAGSTNSFLVQSSTIVVQTQDGMMVTKRFHHFERRNYSLTLVHSDYTCFFVPFQRNIPLTVEEAQEYAEPYEELV